MADDTPFAMVLNARPVSSASGGRHKFQQRVASAASAAFAGQALLMGELYARITWFHRDLVDQDIDNIIKRILDALQGIVFANDRSIRQCLVARISTAQAFTLSDRNQPADVFTELLTHLANGEPHGVYVEIGRALPQRVGFGPIEG